MKLMEIVQPGAIVCQLTASDRDGVIAELVGQLVAAGAVHPDHRQSLLDLLLERERKSTTGFGAGIAVPHAKHAAVNRVCAAVGISQQGVEFTSLDMQPVYSVVLLLSPSDRPEDHLQAMEAIFKLLGHETLRRQLRQATNPADVQSLLEGVDAQHV